MHGLLVLSSIQSIFMFLEYSISMRLFMHIGIIVEWNQIESSIIRSSHQLNRIVISEQQ